MSLIDQALNGLEEMIRVVERRDYNAFLSCLSPRIKDKVDEDSFHNAIRLHSARPLSIEMIDKNTSEIIGKDPSTVKLMMKNGRTLCTFIKRGEKWVTDTIF